MKQIINDFKEELENFCIEISTLNYIYEDNSCSSDIIYCPTCEGQIRITRSKVGISINDLEKMIIHNDNCPKIKSMSILDKFEKITRDVIFIPQMK